MDQIIFYHVWKEGRSVLDPTLWSNPENRLVVVVDVVTVNQLCTIVVMFWCSPHSPWLNVYRAKADECTVVT